ncbi:Piso0_004756 [Millerozyma farinosa CBS 7064]|uniref:Piso0_004756 protein n=1 Tax=Pichia sorbitophila (strain ATCC MYA-4447 / BCRC 22081 / CBS 7064 / NBRC 10061 / NRRL Y-12695) TaxID=559304 RepID=G8Y0C0_PICSO|nr:Piso0_004756 [Millerozyma farinosa CBS 7064]
MNKLVATLEVPHEGHDNPTILKNPDLEPMPPQRRIWGFWAFFGYWAVPNITIWTWSTGSAMLALGLNIQHTMGALTIANILIIVYTCLNSGPGSKYHIGYTVCQRMIFGIYGSSIGILIRVALSIVFYGSQSWLGGLGMVLIFSSFGKGYFEMKDTFPSSLAMSTRDFIGFLCFHIIQFIFFFKKPEKMARYVNFSCFITAIAFVAVFVTCLVKNGGPGSIFHEKVTLSSSKTGWMWLYSMTIWYGALSPDCTNQSDFSRFAYSKKQMHLGIIVSILISGTLVPLFGLLCASATKDLYGKSLWLPTDIVLQWLSEDYSPGLRAASFFLGFCFASSQLTFNVLANGFAGGMDLAGVMPKFINIRRGAIITTLLSWAVQPWNFYNTSSVFMSVMSSFGVIVTPIIAIIVAEFHLIRKGKIPLYDLYITSSEGAFYYCKGFNIRAIVVWIISVIPGLPGLASSVTKKHIPSGLNNFFYGNIVFGFVCPLILHTIVGKIFPPKGLEEQDKEDIFSAFTLKECKELNIAPHTSVEYIDGVPDKSEKAGINQTTTIETKEMK